MANSLWGAPRIHGELLKLGIKVSQATVAKYMARQPKPPSQTWRTFLHNHVKDLVSTDFFESRLLVFEFCLFLSLWPTIGVGCFISTLPRIPDSAGRNRHGVENEMKESHIESLASHDDPESCAGNREVAAEALTGERRGGVWSRETRCNQGADAVGMSGRQNTGARKGEGTSDPAQSKTSSTCGNFMRENREIPCPPPGDGPGGRAGKVDDRNPAMCRRGKSDSSVLPTKPPNTARKLAAEVESLVWRDRVFGIDRDQSCSTTGPPVPCSFILVEHEEATGVR
jgi:hypothetical protein